MQCLGDQLVVYFTMTLYSLDLFGKEVPKIESEDDLYSGYCRSGTYYLYCNNVKEQ